MLLSRLNTEDIVGLEYETRSTYIEKQQAAVAEVFTIIDVTEEAGVIYELKLITDNNSVAGDSELRIYTDGEVSPSVNTDLGTLGQHYIHNKGTIKLSSDHFSTETNGSSYRCFIIRLPIPYKTGIKITITTRGASAPWWISAKRHINRVLPWKLNCSTSKLVTATTYTSTQIGDRTVQFLSLPEGTDAIIAYLSYIGLGVSNNSYLEANPVIYSNGQIPGTSPLPYYDNTGTEDEFDTAFYQITSSWSNKHGWGFKHNAAYGITFMRDYLAHGGIYVKNGCTFCLENGVHASNTPITTSSKIAWACLYYTRN